MNNLNFNESKESEIIVRRCCVRWRRRQRPYRHGQIHTGNAVVLLLHIIPSICTHYNYHLLSWMCAGRKTVNHSTEFVQLKLCINPQIVWYQRRCNSNDPTVYRAREKLLSVSSFCLFRSRIHLRNSSVFVLLLIAAHKNRWPPIK